VHLVFWGMQCVAVCCNVLQSVAVWWCMCVVCIWYIEVCSVLQCVAQCCSLLQFAAVRACGVHLVY